MLFYNEEDYNDYHYGSDAGRSEFQNAYDSARWEAGSGRVDADKVARLTSCGFWVVLTAYTRYCPYTDAVNGINEIVAVVSRSKDAVEDYLEGLEGDDDLDGFKVHPPESPFA